MLDRAAQKYLAKALAESTQQSYQSAQRRFLHFCNEGNFRAVPASLGCYVSYLAERGLKHNTIKVYLSTIHFLHISGGEADPFKPTLLWLQYILQGIKRSEAQKQVEKIPRLPVSPSIQVETHLGGGVFTAKQDYALGSLLSGFLRMGDMTVPSLEAYDLAVHLNKEDVAVDDSQQHLV